MIFAREKHKVRLITNERYFLQARQPDVSRPRYLRAGGRPPGARSRTGALRQADRGLSATRFREAARTGRRTWTGAILKIDRFGNIITNFSVEDFPDLDKRAFEMAAGPQRINVLARNYAACGPGEPFLILGSAGYYEISVSQASAAKLLGCAAGAPLELTLL